MSSTSFLSPTLNTTHLICQAHVMNPPLQARELGTTSIAVCCALLSLSTIELRAQLYTTIIPMQAEKNRSFLLRRKASSVPCNSVLHTAQKKNQPTLPYAPPSPSKSFYRRERLPRRREIKRKLLIQNDCWRTRGNGKNGEVELSVLA